jgi:hypothetical protein
VVDNEGGAKNAWEGINLRDPNEYIEREETVHRLKAHLNTAHVILVRSPPMSGKTSLAQLLEKDYRQNHEAELSLQKKSLRVLRLSMLWMGSSGGHWTFEKRFFDLVGRTSWEDFIAECDKVKTILIVDEAQVGPVLDPTRSLSISL